MNLIHLLVVLIIIGLILYLVNTYIPMAPPIKTAINVIVVIILCLWLLSVFGIGDFTIPVRRGSLDDSRQGRHVSSAILGTARAALANCGSLPLLAKRGLPKEFMRLSFGAQV